MSPKSPENTERINVFFSSKALKALKDEAQERGIAVSALVRMIVLEWLKKFEAREMTMNEWRKWKANTKRDPICMIYENDDTPIWVMNPNAVHEPALLMGKVKLFINKPTHEQCRAIKWNTTF